MYVKKLTADNDDIDVSAYASLCGAVLVAAAADASVIIYDGATVAGGTDIMKLAAVIGTTVSPNLGGKQIPLKAGASVDITGAGAVLYLYFD